jgi:3-methyladenine DNA glycosylase AlkD
MSRKANPHPAVNVASLAEEIAASLQKLRHSRTAEIRAARRMFSRRLTGADAEAVINLALRVLDKPGSASRFVAYELVCHHRAALGRLRAVDLRRFGRGLDSWGAVDTFACYLAGPAWRERQVADSLIYRWARSPDRWWRRTALVCTVPLNNKARGGRGDTARTLAVCRLLVADRDDMVSKALSWALRELAKRDAPAARAFLDEYADSLAARIIREVRNKLATGLKNPRKKPSPHGA